MSEGGWGRQVEGEEDSFQCVSWRTAVRGKGFQKGDGINLALYFHELCRPAKVQWTRRGLTCVEGGEVEEQENASVSITKEAHRVR